MTPAARGEHNGRSRWRKIKGHPLRLATQIRRSEPALLIHKRKTKMNQSELILKTAQISGLSKNDVEHALKTAGDVIGAALVEDGEAILPGLGKLVTHHQAERAGKNPKTGAPLIIPARKAVKFKVAKALKEAVAK